MINNNIKNVLRRIQTNITHITYENGIKICNKIWDHFIYLSLLNVIAKFGQVNVQVHLPIRNITTTKT